MTFLEQQLQKIKYKQNNSLCVGVAVSKKVANPNFKSIVVKGTVNVGLRRIS